jgi:hypothetical protein
MRGLAAMVIRIFNVSGQILNLLHTLVANISRFLGLSSIAAPFAIIAVMSKFQPGTNNSSQRAVERNILMGWIGLGQLWPVDRSNLVIWKIFTWSLHSASYFAIRSLCSGFFIRWSNVLKLWKLYPDLLRELL